jgi:endonuclease YncB( thermonuclease family)
MLFRSILRVIVSEPARPTPGRHLPVQIVRTDKLKAPSQSDAKALIEVLPKANARHVIDGDTVVVEMEWGRMTIRLDSIDCPEDGQHWGNTAKYGLIKLIGGRKVHLEEHGLDHHGRMLATIYVRHENGVEWVNVNERMVTLGHAWVMRKFYDHLPDDRQRNLNRLEAWARSKKVGLWRTPSPVPPWRWRGGAR